MWGYLCTGTVSNTLPLSCEIMVLCSKRAEDTGRLSLSLNPRSQLHLLQSCMEKLVLGWMCYHSDKPRVVTTGLQSCRWPGKSLENLSSLLESQEKPLLSQRLSCIPTLPAACSHTSDPAQCLKRRHICERTGNQELSSKRGPQQSRNLAVDGDSHMAFRSSFLRYRVKGTAFMVHIQIRDCLFYFIFFTHCGGCDKGKLMPD